MRCSTTVPQAPEPISWNTDKFWDNINEFTLTQAPEPIPLGISKLQGRVDQFALTQAPVQCDATVAAHDRCEESTSSSVKSNTMISDKSWFPQYLENIKLLDSPRDTMQINYPITNPTGFGNDRRENQYRNQQDRRAKREEREMKSNKLMSRKTTVASMIYDAISNSGILDTALTVITNPIQNTIAEWLDERVYCSFSIIGHFDTFISKSTTKILLKYLKPKYGKKILMDVDPNFAMCSTSLRKARKQVLSFPELVNKSIRPGIYYNTLDKRGTKLIIVKIGLYDNDESFANGIRPITRQFKTIVITVGPAKQKWMKHIVDQIDTTCAKIVSTATSTDKIRVRNLNSSETTSADIQVRSMDYLTFPQKDSLMNELDRFSRNGRIYKESGVPHRLGMLFSGPRGVGKTSTAYSIAKSLEMDCVSVDLSFFDSNSGSNSFNGSNTVYIIDEIDAQLPKVRETSDVITEDQQKMRDRLIKLLKAMDEMGDGSIIIATTNYPENLDTALIRSGRFDKIVHFDDLTKEWAEKMVMARDLDPNYVLKGQTFPINPAYLEQLIISKILEKNDIKLRKEVNVEDLVDTGKHSEDGDGVIPNSEDTGNIGFGLKNLDSDDDDDIIMTSDEMSSYETICNDDNDAVETNDDEDED